VPVNGGPELEGKGDEGREVLEEEVKIEPL